VPVKIRLTRTGARNEPSYRIIVVDSRKKRDGRFIERIGFYDPKPKEFKYKVDEARAIYWLGQGAIPSPTVKSLFRRAGILKKIHEIKYGQKGSKQKTEISEEKIEDNPPIQSVQDEEKDKEKVSAKNKPTFNRKNTVSPAGEANKINVGGE
jgi:small subunit ribosomal protein S16